MYLDNKKRSILKTISWRIFATVSTCIIVFLFTGKLTLALSVGVVLTALHFFHERLWNRIGFGKRKLKPFVLWFTGLPGAGKSTLGDRAYDYLKRKGLQVERLDGDTVRSIFPNTGYTKEERGNHVKRVGFLASILEKNGVVVVSSFISPYKEAREFVRGLCANFIEVHVKASLETCERRDVKGLYKKARSGEIRHFTGIDDPYEVPEYPDIVVDTDHQSVEDSFLTLKQHIDRCLAV
jgi:adenylylsulfate kinase